MRKIKFADYLKEYLEFNNITNKDFANRIGITPKHLIDILMLNMLKTTLPIGQTIILRKNYGKFLL